MYAFRSSGSRPWLHALVIVSVVGALGLFGLSGADGIRYAWLLQLTAICLAAVGVYLLTRYSLREYRYEIVDSGLEGADGQPVWELDVTSVIGARMTLTARANLRDICAVRVLSRTEFKAKKASLLGDAVLFRCENDPFAPRTCYVTVPAERVVIAIPPDAGMIELLRAAAAMNGRTRETPGSDFFDPADE